MQIIFKCTQFTIDWSIDRSIDWMTVCYITKWNDPCSKTDCFEFFTLSIDGILFHCCQLSVNIQDGFQMQEDYSKEIDAQYRPIAVSIVS